MNPLFTTGVTFAWILASFSLAAIFGVAYVTRRREPEHLVFSFASLSIMVHAISIDLALGEPMDSPLFQGGTLIGLITTVTTIALSLHYALLFGGIRHKRLFTGLYGATAVVTTYACAFGALDHSGVGQIYHHELGISLACTQSVLLPRAQLVGALATIASFATVALLVRASLRGRRDGIAACFGAAIFALALLHDLFVLNCVLPQGPWLTPPGFLAFAFGVGCSLLIRHAVLGKELERRTFELERSYSHLRTTQAELVRKRQLAAVGELAAVIAHEVRNPLAIIMNAVTGLSRRNIAKSDETMLLEILDEEARRLNRLVGDLLRYARPIQLSRQSLDVRNVIERSLHVLNHKENIEVTIENGEHCQDISGDPDLLRIVFGNLIDNAIQAMEGGGELVVRFHPDSRGDRKGIIVAIRDTGPGMSPHVKARATDPFFTTRPSGTGLGLAIVDRIVEAHGGEVRIESEPGEGTTIHVFLPSESVFNDAEELNGAVPISAPVPILEIS